MKILVLGIQGQLGKCLRDHLEDTEHKVLYTSREQLDITDFETTKIKILENDPNIVINATGFTAVDQAEDNLKMANLINHLSIKNIADICKKHGCWLIHISTDYVFDGNSKTPYKEDDITNPQSVYGETKLNGELAIQASGCRHIIIRTSWLFSEYGNNFLKTILRLGAEQEKLSIVSDQLGCPTYAQDLARTIVDIAPKLNAQNTNGLYHYCGEKPCSWYGFASEIYKYAKVKNLKTPSIINPIETSAYPTPAKRPAFSVLDCSKIKNDFGVHASNWYKGIEQVIEKL